MPSRFPEDSKNFRLIGHDQSAAWGGGSIVEVRNGFAFVGGVGTGDTPEGFTVHDVRDPRKPRKVAEFLAPPGTHMHKLRLVGDEILYVNSERLKNESGAQARPGIFIFDVSDPTAPRQVGFFDMPGNGPHRFGVDNQRQLAFMPCDAEGWDKRVNWTLDISDPLKPDVISIWGLPSQKLRHGRPIEKVIREREVTLHGPPMIRGDRMYAAWWGGGASIIDCSDLTDLKLIGHATWAPPFVGSSHTAWPIGDRPYLVVTDEARSRQKFWDSQFMWILDIRDETNPVTLSTYMPDRETYFDRPGRFGAHNILENITSEGPWANIVFLTYFNAGLRAIDVSDPLQPREVGHFVPELPDGQEGIQSNDIGADDEGRIYLIDRWGAGMHILEYTG